MFERSKNQRSNNACHDFLQTKYFNKLPIKIMSDTKRELYNICLNTLTTNFRFIHFVQVNNRLAPMQLYFIQLQSNNRSTHLCVYCHLLVFILFDTCWRTFLYFLFFCYKTSSHSCQYFESVSKAQFVKFFVDYYFTCLVMA